MTSKVMGKESDKSIEVAFVDYVIRRCQKENGVSAKLGRADNPSTEYQSWDILAGFKVKLDSDNQRLPYALIAASIARSKVSKNGSLGLGSAIAKCYSDGNRSDQAKMKLRRLLACDSTPEVCRILRPLMSLMISRGITQLNYAKLLKDLLSFHWDNRQTRIKADWAQNFYGYVDEQDGGMNE